MYLTIWVWSFSSSVYLSLKEEDAVEGTDEKVTEIGSDEVMTESYMTMAQSENCRLVDASIQKNISFDGKPVTPTGWNGGVGEIFSLRDQLKQAEEKASQVQREVWCPGVKNKHIFGGFVGNIMLSHLNNLLVSTSVTD